MLFTNDYSPDPAPVSAAARRDVVARQTPAYAVVAGTLVLLTLLAMIRRREHNAMLLGLAVIFFSLMLSRYYFSLWALLATWTLWGKDRALARYGMIWLFAVFGLATLLWALPNVSVRSQYTVFNLGVTLYFAVLIGRFLAKDIRWLYATRVRKPRGGSHA